MGSFFDAIVISPSEELKLPFEKIDSNGYDSIFSVRGRVACLFRTITHAIGIPFKPIYYIGFWASTKMSISLIPSLPKDALKGKGFEEYQKEYPDEARVIQTLVDNPELLERLEREVSSAPYCALVSPFSQTAQVFKSVLGIIHPGFYYQHDPFITIFQNLSKQAKELGCSSELVDALEDGTSHIHTKLHHVSNRDYYYVIFKRDFDYISNSMKRDDIPSNRKLMLLNMLDPLSSKSGIKGCAPALGRILQQICAQLNIPEEPSAAILHLVNEFKVEIIGRIIMEAENLPSNTRNHNQILITGMAHDPSHRGNAFVIAMQDVIVFSQDTIQRAQNDSMASRARPLKKEEKDNLLQYFNEYYTKDDLMNSLLDQINSKEDGTPGLKMIREQIFQILATKLQDNNDNDTSMEAVIKYYHNKGEGSPSDANFTDLNSNAIYDFTSSMTNNPFSNNNHFN